MELPNRIDARWIDSLADKQLLRAEHALHTTFSRREAEEKRLRGSAYVMLRGPEPLVSAWIRWAMVNNATRARGLQPSYRR
jgi:hypothetical protein